ncbi:hypothetical protein HDU93_008569, partial [Gonapodya sp. JEL0774]
DDAPRAAYITSIVPPHSRTAIFGIVSVARSVSRSIAPSVTGYLSANGHFDVAFWMSGVLGILYNLMLFWSFGSIKPPHEVSDTPHYGVSESAKPRLSDVGRDGRVDEFTAAPPRDGSRADHLQYVSEHTPMMAALDDYE